MSLRTYKNPDGTERSPARLLCDGQVHCKSGSILYEEMLDKVSDILKQCIEDFEIRLTNDTGDSAKLHANLIKNLEKKMENLKAQELSQWEAQSHPDPSQRMPADVFKTLNERLLKQKEEVQQALCKAYESMPEPVNYEEKAARFTEALEALKNPEKDAQTKNTLLKACIDRITYKRDKPERLRSTAKRVTINGRRIRPDGLPTGGNWTTPEVHLDVKLRV
jgi:hypothetical protein